MTLYGPPPGRPRTPTIAFTLAGMPSDAVAAALAAEGVFVSHGDFYATTVVERLGLAEHGLVRAGCACYTNDRRHRPAGGGRARARPLTGGQAGFTGIRTRVFSHSRTSVAPAPAGSLRIVNASTGVVTASLLTFARPTSCAFTAAV